MCFVLQWRRAAGLAAGLALLPSDSEHLAPQEVLDGDSEWQPSPQGLLVALPASRQRDSQISTFGTGKDLHLCM